MLESLRQHKNCTCIKYINLACPCTLAALQRPRPRLWEAAPDAPLLWRDEAQPKEAVDVKLAANVHHAPRLLALAAALLQPRPRAPLAAEGVAQLVNVLRNGPVQRLRRGGGGGRKRRACVRRECAGAAGRGALHLAARYIPGAPCCPPRT